MLKDLRLTEMQSRSDSNNAEISIKHKISNGAKTSNNAESERFRTVRQIAENE